MLKNPHVLIITGPTASGKTDLAESIAQRMGGEIINADVGQFYTGLTVGTAKPEWKNKSFKCHLFDILDTPKDLSVAQYRTRVIDLVENIKKAGKLPIIVGGSMFYIKSLFFPPHEHDIQKNVEQLPVQVDLRQSSNDLWNILNCIDPVRAQELHHNDRYRIERALQIWMATGKKPSGLKPRFTPQFPAHIIFMTPPENLLQHRIYHRTQYMLESGGWVEEAKSLKGTFWENFINNKGLIGYKKIFEWLETSPQKNPEHLIAHIGLETRQYAKRQMVFLKKFKQQLEEEAGKTSAMITTQTISQVDSAATDLLINTFLQSATGMS